MELLVVAGKTCIVYLFIILAIRLFGKRELSQLSIIDLVFILLISNSVQNAMVGSDTSLGAGLVAATSLFALNSLLKYGLFKNKKLTEMLQGGPVLLVHQGIIVTENLEKEKITEEELLAVIREHGIKNIEETDLAILEVDGNISVLSNNYQTRSTKKHKVHKSLAKNN